MSFEHIEVNALQVGSGQPWRQQYDINTEQSGDIVNWKTETPLPGVLSHSQAVVTKNRVYLLGGWVNNDAVSTVYTAPINSDGTLGKWATDTPLPEALSSSQAIVTKNRIYLLGGYGNGVITSVVYTTAINEDGTLGEWTTGPSLPDGLFESQVIVTKNRAYLLGGWIGHPLSIVYTTTINENGTLDEWTTGTPLPNAFSGSQAIVTKNRVYLLGGVNASGAISSTYTASINSDGTLGEWIADTPLPNALRSSQAIVTKNRVYLLGGWGETIPTATVLTANIGSDGTLGSWNVASPLLNTLASSQIIVAKNRIHLLGGWIGTSTAAVYSAAISGGLNDYSPYYSDDTVEISE